MFKTRERGASMAHKHCGWGGCRAESPCHYCGLGSAENPCADALCILFRADDLGTALTKVDDELPGVGEVEERPRDEPDRNDPDGAGKGSRAATFIANDYRLKT